MKPGSKQCDCLCSRKREHHVHSPELGLLAGQEGGRCTREPGEEWEEGLALQGTVGR